MLLFYLWDRNLILAKENVTSNQIKHQAFSPYVFDFASLLYCCFDDGDVLARLCVTLNIQYSFTLIWWVFT